MAVSLLGNRAQNQATAARYGLGGPLGVTTGNLLNALGVAGVPATAFVSADGRVVAVAEGALSERELEAELAKLTGGD